MERLQSLQILRFVAAAAVVHCHAWGMLHGAHNVGAAGVDVFFVISGYIVSTTAMRRPEGFLRHRLIRVLPIYYLALAPMLASLLDAGTLEPVKLIASVTLWPVYDQLVFPALGQAWSLSFELVFYLALAAVLAGAPWWIVLVYYAECLAAGQLTGWPVFVFLGSPIILEFLMGVGLALLTWRSRAAGAVALIAALAAFGFYGLNGDNAISSLPMLQPFGFGRVALWGLPAGLLVFGAMQFEAYLKGRTAAFFAYLGDASYSLYLFHLLTMVMVQKVLPQAGLTTLIVSSIAASVIIYRMVEKPSLTYLRARARGAAPSVALVDGSAAAPGSGGGPVREGRAESAGAAPLRAVGAGSHQAPVAPDGGALWEGRGEAAGAAPLRAVRTGDVVDHDPPVPAAGGPLAAAAEPGGIR